MQIHIENLNVHGAGPAAFDIEAFFKRVAEPEPATVTAQAPRIGQPWPGQGGVYAGLIRCVDGDYHLIIPTDPAGGHPGIKWGERGTDAKGATSDTNGPANTDALLETIEPYPAAEWAAQLSIEGHDDWYLPSRRELRLAWVNVPELFESGWYWSSTHYSADYAWYQYFGGGTQGCLDKLGELRARAVRRFKA